MKRPHIVIIGAGFGGICAAKILAKHKEVDVTIVDRRNHHLFQPLLYQVATAGLSPADIAAPIRHIFAGHQNVTVLLDEAVGFSPAQKLVKLKTRELNYDYLIVACGANHSYFGRDEWEENAPGLKTLEQATELRRRILAAFEAAENDLAPEKLSADMTFAIVGGGPTGVELAGAISELSKNTLVKDFRNIDPRKARILLVEAGPKILAQFHEALGERALKDLRDMGVEVMTNTRVLDVTKEGIKTDKEMIPASTVIWAAGVKPSITSTELSKSDTAINLDKGGRILVKEDLSVPGHAELFVIGDQANFTIKDSKALPGLAPVAMQQGRHAARNILKLVKGEAATPFHYTDKGQMATIGRKRAVVQVNDKIRFGGFFAWLTWLLIHIYYIIGFRNRLFVFLEWMWSYMTYNRGARLIVAKDWKLKP